MWDIKLSTKFCIYHQSRISSELDVGWLGIVHYTHSWRRKRVPNKKNKLALKYLLYEHLRPRPRQIRKCGLRGVVVCSWFCMRLFAGTVTNLGEE